MVIMKSYHASQKNFKSQFGYTLVEMYIVIAIIGLLIAGIISGENLYQASKLRRLSTEITQYTAAINQFKQEYQYYPGDFPQADAFWGGTVQGSANGNGDGVVDYDYFDYNAEDVGLWRHLSKSGIISASYRGYLDAYYYELGITNPASDAFKNLGFAFFMDDLYYDYEYPHYQSLTNNLAARLHIASLDEYGEPFSSDKSLSSKETLALDTKMDDGLADSGRLITYNLLYYHSYVDGCVTNDYDASEASYNLSSSRKNCIMQWYFDN